MGQFEKMPSVHMQVLLENRTTRHSAHTTALGKQPSVIVWEDQHQWERSHRWADSALHDKGVTIPKGLWVREGGNKQSLGVLGHASVPSSLLSSQGPGICCRLHLPCRAADSVPLVSFVSKARAQVLNQVCCACACGPRAWGLTAGDGDQWQEQRHTVTATSSQT